MGPTLDDVARSLSRSMPIGGICVTAEQDRVHILRAEADRRRTILIQVDPDSVSEDEVRRFPYIAFKENVAVALAVAELIGVDRDTALAGMVAARPDPGTVAVQTYQADQRRISFANIFAANDPASSLMNINLLTDRGLIDAPFNVVINCRPDRIERNGQMGALTGRMSPERIVLIGEQTRSAKVAVPAELTDRVVDLGDSLDFTALLDALVTDADGGATLIAIGNIHGQGEILLDRLHELPIAPARTTPQPVAPIGRATIARRLAQHHFEWLLRGHGQNSLQPISSPHHRPISAVRPTPGSSRPGIAHSAHSPSF